MIATALYARLWGDVTGPGMLLLFGPRWWLLLPWIVVMPAALFVSWRLGVIAVCGAAIGLFGVTEFELPLRVPRSNGERAIRLVTYNTDRSPQLATRIRDDLAAWDADVVLLQDCKTIVGDSLRSIAGITVHSTPEFCIASRLPIDTVEILPQSDRQESGAVGKYGSIARYRVRTAHGVIPIYSLHLESPRDALWSARNFDLSLLRKSIAVRGADSRRASAWVNRSDSAFVVAGDFNLPTGSAILRSDWADLSDAFSVAGFGFGNTMFAGHFAVRIDHVLVPSTLAVSDVEVRRGYPSEHQPLIVDINWRTR